MSRLVFCTFIFAALAIPVVASAVAVCPVCDNIEIMCPPLCTDGPGCQGVCLPPGGPKGCMGTGCSGNKAGDGDKASPGGAEQAMQMAKQIADALKGKGGGGGGGGGQPPPANQGFNQPCQPGDKTNYYTGQPCPGAENTTAKSILGDIFSTSGTEGGATDKLKDIASDILSSLGFTGGESGTTTQPTSTSTSPAGAPLGSGMASTTAAAGTTLTEEVVESEGGVTVRATGSDAATDTGIAGFFGQLFNLKPISKDDTFLGRLCAARPWQASFVTRLFSPDFFDTLCKRRGYAVGTAAVQKTAATGAAPAARAKLTCPAQAPVGGDVKLEWDCFKSTSSGIGFDTKGRSSGAVTLKGNTTATYALHCASGARASCVTTVANPRVQIVAQPPRVPLNSRAAIYWTSEAVSECTVTGPGLKEKGLKGAATTLPILESVTFTIVCKTDGGLDVKDSATVDVGP